MKLKFFVEWERDSGEADAEWVRLERIFLEQSTAIDYMRGVCGLAEPMRVVAWGVVATKNAKKRRARP